MLVIMVYIKTGQFTQGGTLASDDLAVYQVSPGKAFVKGYEVETISSTYIDCPKPRTSKRLENQGVAYKTGNSVRINNVQWCTTNWYWKYLYC